MTVKKGRPRTKGGDRSAADVRADDPKQSLARLASLAKRVLKVSREEIRERDERVPDKT